MDKIEKDYKCDEGHVHKLSELNHYYDFGYDQKTCPTCGEVMFDELYGIQYCEEINPQP